MSDKIELFSPGSRTPCVTIFDHTGITLYNDDTCDVLYYDGPRESIVVSDIVAEFESNQLDLTILPRSGARTLRWVNIAGVSDPLSSGTPVSCGISWEETGSDPAKGLALHCLTPGGPSHGYEWTFGSQDLPAVQLKVKIRRQ